MLIWACPRNAGRFHVSGSHLREIIPRMGIGAIIVVIGIVLALTGRPVIGIIIALIGLAFGGFRRGSWY